MPQDDIKTPLIITIVGAIIATFHAIGNYFLYDFVREVNPVNPFLVSKGIWTFINTTGLLLALGITVYTLYLYRQENLSKRPFLYIIILGLIGYLIGGQTTHVITLAGAIICYVNLERSQGPSKRTPINNTGGDKFCEKCGARTEPNGKFCGECGASLQEAGESTAQSDSKGDLKGIREDIENLSKKEPNLDTREVEKAIEENNLTKARKKFDKLEKKYSEYEDIIDELEGLEERKSSLATKLADKEIDRNTYKDASQSIKTKKAELEEKLEQLREEIIYEDYEKPF